MTERDSNGRFAEGNPGGPGPAIGNLNGQKHGLNRLRRTVEELGGRLLDGRSATVKALNAWRTEIIRDLGGMQELTATKPASPGTPFSKAKQQRRSFTDIIKRCDS